ncbi:MAG: glycosyltransferase family 87 protein [Acidobacteriota bacterium]
MRVPVSLALSLAVGIFGFTAVLGVTHSIPAAGLIALAVGAVTGWGTYRHPAIALDEGACSARLKALAAGGAVVALVLVARLSVYIVDPAQVSYSLIPSSDWEVRHSCVSAYVVAGAAARAHPNVYDERLYNLPNDDPTAIRKARSIGPFKIDVFEYPPQFLLLPRGLQLLAPAFLDQRMLWFALEGGVILLALLLVARFVGPAAGTRALLLSPLVWAAVPTLSMLQKGNVHGVIIAISMVAMVLFERRRFASGGLLLGFATVSKLYPGLLCFYLLARRQWRAAAWTAAMGAALSVLTLADLGWAPFSSFLDHLPGLVGGEAFPAFRNPSAIAINMSVPGLAWKLKLFGVPGMGFAAAKIIGWIYTVIALVATVLAARRPQTRAEMPLVWLAILILATLRSPFLPNAYGVFPALWLLTLLASTYVPRPRVLGWTLAAWATLNIYWAVDWPVDPRIKALVNLLPQGLMVVLAVLALRRRAPDAAEPAASDFRQVPSGQSLAN